MNEQSRGRRGAEPRARPPACPRSGASPRRAEWPAGNPRRGGAGGRARGGRPLPHRCPPPCAPAPAGRCALRGCAPGRTDRRRHLADGWGSGGSRRLLPRRTCVRARVCVPACHPLFHLTSKEILFNPPPEFAGWEEKSAPPGERRQTCIQLGYHGRKGPSCSSPRPPSTDGKSGRPEEPQWALLSLFCFSPLSVPPSSFYLPLCALPPPPISSPSAMGRL